MKMYNRSLTDIELALSTNCSENVKAKLNALRAACQGVIKSNPYMTEPNLSFASFATAEEQRKCCTCSSGQDVNFIACSQCADVVFCSKKCLDANLTHKLDCNILFQRMDNKAKNAIRKILEAVEMFSIENLMICIGSGDVHRSHLRLKNLTLNANFVLYIYKLFKSTTA